MGQITISLNGRSYRLSCGDGEETRLKELADYVSQRVDDLATEFSQVGDDRLIVMAALMIADELFDAREALQQLPLGVGTRPDRFGGDEATRTPGDFFASRLPDYGAAESLASADTLQPEVSGESELPGAPVMRRDTRRSDGRASLEERLAEARNKASGNVRLSDRK